MRTFLIQQLNCLDKVDEYKVEKYVDFCLNNNLGKNIDDSNLHHILPKADKLFPEYSNLKKYKWNGVYLTYKNHQRAHEMLAEAIDNSSIFHAWWMMFKNEKKYDKDLYEKSIEYKRQISKEVNKGMVVCKSISKPELKNLKVSVQEFKNNDDLIGSTTGKGGEHLKNTISIIDENGKIIRIKKEDYNPEIHRGHTAGKTVFKHFKTGETKMLPIDDPLVLSGEYVGIMKGKKIQKPQF